MLIVDGKKERMGRALRRQSVDRLPVQTNYTPAMGHKLAQYFHIPESGLPARLENHLLRVDISYALKTIPEGAPAAMGQRMKLDWWGAGWDSETEGYWHSYAPLGGSNNLDQFVWPDPDGADLLEAAHLALATDAGAHFVVPNFGFALFERAWSLRGFDQLLMDMATDPDWVADLLDRITDIQVRLARRFVELGVDGGYFGDDYGAQRSMIFSPATWRRLIKPRLARLFTVFQEAGLPVMLHSDGDIWPILPDLVEIGLNCLNPVQPEVLEHGRLYRQFGKHLSFYGGISTQSVLPDGSPAEVAEAIRACVRDLAPDGTGLVLGPSHRMQSDIPVENVEAMLKEFSV